MQKQKMQAPEIGKDAEMVKGIVCCPKKSYNSK